MNDDMNGYGGKMTGFLMGALVGAITGASVSLLLAPRSGKETRGWLNSKYREVRDRSGKALLRQEQEAHRGDIAEFGGDHEIPAYRGSSVATARP